MPCNTDSPSDLVPTRYIRMEILKIIIMTKRKVLIIGTSIGVTIPKQLADLHGIKDGTELEIEEVAGEGLLYKYPEKVTV